MYNTHPKQNKKIKLALGKLCLKNDQIKCEHC